MGIIFKKDTTWERSHLINMQLFNAVLLFGCVVTTVYGHFATKAIALGDMEMDFVSVARSSRDNIVNACTQTQELGLNEEFGWMNEQNWKTSNVWARDALRSCCSKTSFDFYQTSLIEPVAGLT